MMRNTRYPVAGLLVLLLLLMPLVGVAALDWGGSISSSTSIKSLPDGSDDEVYSNTERLVLYLNTPLGSLYRLESQAVARFDLEPLLFAADLERLYVERMRRPTQGNLNEVMTRMGRQTITDPAGLVVRQAVDGVAVIVRYPLVEVGLSAGYAGLINKEFSTISMSLRDSLDSSDDDIYFGPPRLIGQGRVVLSNLFAQQSLRLAFTFQEDLRDRDDVVQPGDERPVLLDAGRELGGLLDTQYIQAVLDGPIPFDGVPGQLYYNAAYVLNLGRTLSLVEDEAADSGQSYQYRPIRAHLAQLQFQYFLPSFLGSAAGLGVQWSSGDKNAASFTEGNTSEVSRMFTPVSGGGTGLVFGLDSGNSTTVEVFYSLRPFDGHSNPVLGSMQAQLAGYSFFRTAGGGPVSVGDVDAATSESYLGSEVDLALRFRPFSDFGFGLSAGMFFGNESALVEGSNSVDYVVRLDASLSF